VVDATPWPIYPQESDPVSIVQEVGWAPVTLWTGADHAAHSESLYQLHYPGPFDTSMGMRHGKSKAKYLHFHH
jgi:hypothetical protein